ncbi:hypothetical protein AVEN_82758-1 [Araneus ventricosus]|uniref:Uncharacterized protein n=1 Tax=Araneus ventricosus TaxID=182803 RepID=A0A4Y2E949_ARAVE|nr:hypothetical protein AVEN_82758-1 [Araneus ventricosus]
MPQEDLKLPPSGKLRQNIDLSFQCFPLFFLEKTEQSWCGEEAWREGCKLRRRRRPRHLTAVQIYEVLPKIARGCGSLEARSRIRHQRVAGSKPDSTEDPPCMVPAARQIIRSGQTFSRLCGADVWRGGCQA